jgi:hybrid cluster-associated redox disulfide protein
MKITKFTTLGELTKKYPKSIEVLLKYGLHCFGCAMSEDETLEQGAKTHGITDKEIKQMIKEINKVINLKQQAPITK